MNEVPQQLPATGLKQVCTNLVQARQDAEGVSTFVLAEADAAGHLTKQKKSRGERPRTQAVVIDAINVGITSGPLNP